MKKWTIISLGTIGAIIIVTIITLAIIELKALTTPINLNDIYTIQDADISEIKIDAQNANITVWQEYLEPDDHEIRIQDNGLKNYFNITREGNTLLLVKKLT